MSESKLEIDANLICILLCRNSLDLVRIKGSLIKSYLIPAIKSRMVRENEMIKVSSLSRKSDKENKLWFETPYENLTLEQQNNAREAFLKKLTDFLYEKK